MERILINDKHGELRVAMVKDRLLSDIDVERTSQTQTINNIYKGKIVKIQHSLNAVFVDYGSQGHGFLPIKEIAPEYFTKGEPGDPDALEIGQDLLIQVVKERRGNKNPAVTTYYSLASCYLVLMPNNPKAGGVSRRIEGEERTELRDILNQLSVPADMGLIIRTAALGKTIEDIAWELEILLKQMEAIENAYKEAKKPALLFQEGNIIVRAIRDHLRPSIGEIIIDDEQSHEIAKQYIQQLRPEFLKHVKLYKDSIPLFNRFQIERQIETSHQREVRLPSGGSIVIDHTEALISVDVNSASSTRGGNIEETALSTNLEAADEIARQLRLRDLGGLIIIDFIDMTPVRNQREVENCLREALKMDRARVQIGRISRFGLLEMSRQRLRPSLSETVQVVCPRCNGQGTIRRVESLVPSIMRLIEEEAMKDKRHGRINSTQIRVQLPVKIATFLLNEKRSDIAHLETEYGVTVFILPNTQMETPHFKIERYQGNDEDTSYELVDSLEEELEQLLPETETNIKEEPAVKEIDITEHMRARPERKKRLGTGLVTRIVKALFSDSDQDKVSRETNKQQHTSDKEDDQKSDQRQYQNPKGQGGRRPGGRGNAKQGGNYNKGNRRQNNRTRRNDNRDNQTRDYNVHKAAHEEMPIEHEIKSERRDVAAKYHHAHDKPVRQHEPMESKPSAERHHAENRPSVERHHAENKPSVERHQPVVVKPEPAVVVREIVEPVVHKTEALETPVVSAPKQAKKPVKVHKYYAMSKTGKLEGDVKESTTEKSEEALVVPTQTRAQPSSLASSAETKVSATETTSSPLAKEKKPVAVESEFNAAATADVKVEDSVKAKSQEKNIIRMERQDFAASTFDNNSQSQNSFAKQSPKVETKSTLGKIDSETNSEKTGDEN